MCAVSHSVRGLRTVSLSWSSLASIGVRLTLIIKARFKFSFDSVAAWSAAQARLQDVTSCDHASEARSGDARGIRNKTADRPPPGGNAPACGSRLRVCAVWMCTIIVAGAEPVHRRSVVCGPCPKLQSRTRTACAAIRAGLRLPSRRVEDYRPGPMGAAEDRIRAAMLSKRRKDRPRAAAPSSGGQPLRGPGRSALAIWSPARLSQGNLPKLHNSVIFSPRSPSTIHSNSA